MAKIVAVLGEKGGNGKSTISHLLGHGAGSLASAIDAAVITTDPGDIPLTGQRRYLPLDGRDPDSLGKILQTLDQQERFLVILDGAAARPHIDKVAGQVADLILLPFAPSYQDAARALKDLARLPEAVALPNRWPTHPAVAARAQQFLDMIPAERRLPPVPALPRTDELLDPAAYGRVATNLSRPSQALLLNVLHRMKVHPIDLASK